MAANKHMKDGERFGLAEIALRFLGIKEKEDIIKGLCKEYKVKGRAIAENKLYSVKGLPHNPKFKKLQQLLFNPFWTIWSILGPFIGISPLPHYK